MYILDNLVFWCDFLNLCWLFKCPRAISSWVFLLSMESPNNWNESGEPEILREQNTNNSKST